jgi:hypothetical protein
MTHPATFTERLAAARLRRGSSSVAHTRPRSDSRGLVRVTQRGCVLSFAGQSRGNGTGRIIA